MKFNETETYDIMRRQLWVDAAIACIGSDSCKAITTATIYADRILKDYDERFPATPREIQ